MDAVLYVQNHGLGICREYTDDGTVRLNVYPADRLTPRLRSFIRDHRDDLLELLSVPNIDHMVGNLLALPQEGRDGFRAEVEARGPEDELYDMDMDALQRAETVLAMRQERASRIRVEESA